MTLQSQPTSQKIKTANHVHLVGIGGFGLSAIARVLIGQGYTVSGCDQRQNELTHDLVKEGIQIFTGHDVRHLEEGVNLVLMSSAIPANNPEIMAANASGIPVLKRSQFLSAMMQNNIGIAVAGSHGKSTTSGMLAQIMINAGLDPTVIVGGVLPLIGGGGRAGQGDYFVVEADEYDHMFLGLEPSIAVITNVEYDHPDLFKNQEEYIEAFRAFLKKVQPGGRYYYCADDSVSKRLADDLVNPTVEMSSFGLVSGGWRANDLRPNQFGGTDFLVQNDADYVGIVRLRIPGKHNVYNALAAIAVTSGLGIEFEIIRKSLADFGGIGRRFQIIGEIGDVTIIDDYAHHPTEIKATLAAARQRFPGRRIWAVWQPHTFTRTKILLNEFAESFQDADRVIALRIFESREKGSYTFDTSLVISQMHHPYSRYIPEINDAAQYILERILPGDVIITLTAGDGNLVGREILSGLASLNHSSAQPPLNDRHLTT